MAVEPTYFTCTLGQAASLRLQQLHKTINDLVDWLANDRPDRPAVGFAVPAPTQPWSSRVYTFAEISKGTKVLAEKLSKRYEHALLKRTTVGLLFPSTPEFLFIWLALIRLGHGVLLIAPQCAPAAVASLYEQCSLSILFFDESYADLVKETTVAAGSKTITSTKILFDGDMSIEALLKVDLPEPRKLSEPIRPEDIAYLHHTSGTSTGIPKPIPQSHNAGVGVLPAFDNGWQAATFTTTPLYHGGVADLFRAWASSALIWLFPGKAVPITAANIIKCLQVAEKQLTPRIKYFSSVPYVLQLLASEETGLKLLQGMDMVGVGGAALPAEVGDKLISQNVNLLSRFGSAECGFLLSSHRDYVSDSAWQYLRPAASQQFIRFEPRDAGLSELIVLKGWPHMAKQNRDDGSFATSDLFEPHPDIGNAWRYHSRADSQLTLITGKKFDPAPIEADVATLPQLSDAIIFGSGRPFPGVLLFRSGEAADLSDDDLSELVWTKVASLNKGSQDHAKLSRAMLVPMAVLQTPLEKSSKGTLLRGVAETRFAKDIDSAYNENSAEQANVSDTNLPEAVEKIVRNVSHRTLTLTPTTDLFSAGIDSVAGMQIRSRLRGLLPEEHREVPMTIVEDCGTIDRLSDWILKRRAGQIEASNLEDEHDMMRSLVDEYSQFASPEPVSQVQEDAKLTIVLTGATGALGAHILDQYRKMDCVRRIYCLVRGDAGRERVARVLQQRKLSSLTDRSDKVIVLQAKLGEADLGLDKARYDCLASEVTTIMHVAWSVNFRVRLSSFVQDNIASVRNLITLALASPRTEKPVFSFCSSVASAMAWHEDLIPERLLDDPAAATSLGYSRSKWVAEQICARAGAGTALQGKVGIFRVGQLAGDTVHGVWNSSEAWPIMLRSATATHCLPALQDEVVNWLPVDIAATALIEGTAYVKDQASPGVHVFHVLNSHTRPSWMDLIVWLQSSEKIDGVNPAEWVKQIEALEKSEPTHPALKLLSHWQRAYGNDDSGQATKPGKQFAVNATQANVPVLRTVRPVDEAYFGKLWRWIQQEM